MRIVAGLFAFLVLANATASIVLAWRPVNRGNWLVRSKWELLDQTATVDTLVLGDSSCNQGVRPDVLDASLGTRSLNLCTIGNLLAVNDAWMLDEYIAKHGAPKRVIVVHVYDMWSREADHVFVQLVGKIPRPWGFWSRMTPSIGFGATEVMDVISSKWLPLHSETRSILTWLRSPARAMATRYAMDDRGFMAVTEPAPRRVAADTRKHERKLAGASAAPSPPNRLALLRIDELARRHGIEITLATAPMFSGLWANPAMQAHLTQQRAAIRTILGPSSPIRVLDGPPLTFAAGEMENVDHVVGDAARAYTEWLAERVRLR